MQQITISMLQHGNAQPQLEPFTPLQPQTQQAMESYFHPQQQPQQPQQPQQESSGHVHGNYFQSLERRPSITSFTSNSETACLNSATIGQVNLDGDKCMDTSSICSSTFSSYDDIMSELNNHQGYHYHLPQQLRNFSNGVVSHHNNMCMQHPQSSSTLSHNPHQQPQQDTQNSASVSSNNCNSGNGSIELNNLFSLIDSHRKLLLIDNIVEDDLSMLNHDHQQHQQDWLEMDNRSFIDLRGGINQNESSSQRCSTTESSMFITNNDNINNNVLNRCPTSSNQELFEITQALQNLTSLGLSPCDQEQLSKLIIWNAVMNRYGNVDSKLNETTATTTQIKSGNPSQSRNEFIGDGSGSYQMFDSFEESQSKEKANQNISQQVNALTLHQMDDDNSPTMVKSSSTHFRQCKLKKYNSQPVISTNSDTYSMNNNIGNSILLQPSSSSYIMEPPCDMLFQHLTPPPQTLNSSSPYISHTQNLTSIAPLSSCNTFGMINFSNEERNFDSGIPIVTSPVHFSPSTTTTTCSLLCHQNNSNQNLPHYSESRKRLCQSTNQFPSSTQSSNHNPLNQQQHNLDEPNSLQPLSAVVIKHPPKDNSTSATTTMAITPSKKSSCINFSLPGKDYESALAVKKFGNHTKTKSLKKYSTPPTNQSSLCATSIEAEFGEAKGSNTNPTASTLAVTTTVSLSPPLLPFPPNPLIANPTTTTKPPENSRVNLSTEDTSAAFINNKFQQLTLNPSSSGSNCSNSSTNSIVVKLSTQSNHNAPELSITPPTQSLTESNLDNTQYLNNTDNIYTMSSSHSPVSSSNSNEQKNGQQYQGVMPLEGNQSSWGVKVNRKYRQLRKSLKTCKHFEDNYFVLELNGQQQGGAGNPSSSSTSMMGGNAPPGIGGQTQQSVNNKPKAKSKPKSSPRTEDKKQAIPPRYKEQVGMMGEFSLAKNVEDEVLPLSILNRTEENDNMYLTTPQSTSSISSKSSSAANKDSSKKKRKNASKEPARKNRKKDAEFPQQECNELPLSMTTPPQQQQPMSCTILDNNFNRGAPHLMSLQPPTPPQQQQQLNNNHHQHHQQIQQIQQIPSLISPPQLAHHDYHSTTTPTSVASTVNYENTSNPIIPNNTSIIHQHFENNINTSSTTTSTNQINNQPSSESRFSSGFPSSNSFGLFSTTADFTTMKLPSSSSIDSFFKADLTEERFTAMPRNLSSSSDFLPLEEANIHLHPIVNPTIINNHPITTTTTQAKTIPPKIEINEPKKEVERKQLTRSMNHASLSMLDEEEEEAEHDKTSHNVTSLPPISTTITTTATATTQESHHHHSSTEPSIAIENIKSKSPLITPLNALLYKNISVSNMDLVKLDVPSAATLRPIPSESEMVEKDHSHWLNEIKTSNFPSNDSLTNMVDFDILYETKRH